MATAPSKAPSSAAVSSPGARQAGPPRRRLFEQIEKVVVIARAYSGNHHALKPFLPLIVFVACSPPQLLESHLFLDLLALLLAGQAPGKRAIAPPKANKSRGGSTQNNQQEE